MRSPRSYLLALLAVLAAGNLWVTFHRSGIPADLTGHVRDFEHRHEKHSGIDDVYLVTVGDRVTHVDAETAGWIRIDDQLVKPAWSSSLETPRGTHELGVSAEFRRMVAAMPLVLLIGLGLLWAAARRSRREAESSESRAG